MIVVKVRDRDIKAAPMGPVTTGSVGLPVSWHFSEEWDDLAKTAVFRVGNDGTEITVAVLEDLCLVPDELLVQANAGENLWIGVYGWKGTNANDTIVPEIAMPTIWTYTRIQDGSQPSGIEPPEGTPGWSAQIQNATDEALRVAHGVAADAAEGDFDGISPAVTISSITHGHSVTITDRDHPEGQSFDVLDGDSAYEQAVAGGYTGTEAQFNEELASFKELSEQAADSANTAAGAAFRAQNYERHAGDAEDAARAYADIALIRMNSADQSAQSAAGSASNASRDAGTASTAATTATTKAGEASDSATAADGSAKDSEAYAIGKRGGTDVGSTDPAYHNNAKYYAEQAASSASDAVTAKGAAETAQGKAEDAQGAAEAVLESIPSDYTDLTEDVDDLKSAIETYTGNREIEFIDGYYIPSQTSPVNINDLHEDATFKCAAIDCAEGDSFTLSIKGAVTARTWCFIDSNNTIIQVAGSRRKETNTVLTAPKNATKLILNDLTNGVAYYGEFVGTETARVADSTKKYVEAVNGNHNLVTFPIYTGNVPGLQIPAVISVQPNLVYVDGTVNQNALRISLANIVDSYTANPTSTNKPQWFRNIESLKVGHKYTYAIREIGGDYTLDAGELPLRIAFRHDGDTLSVDTSGTFFVEEYVNSIYLHLRKGTYNKCWLYFEVIDVTANTDNQYINFNFTKLRPMFDHLFVNNEGNNITIPAESLTHIRLSPKMGFNVIELHPQKTSDGQYIVNHLINGTFARYFHHVDGTTDISSTSVADVTLSWILENVRYNSIIVKYQTAPPTLEEALRECRTQNLIPMVYITDDTVHEMCVSIMGELNFIAYNGTRQQNPNGIIMHWKSDLTDFNDILNYCKTIGKPFIYGVGNLASFTGSQREELSSLLHQNGYYLSYSYADNNNWWIHEDGLDFNATNRSCNRIESGNLHNLSTVFGFDSFTYTNASVVEGCLTYSAQGTLTPDIENASYDVSCIDLEIVYKGSITLNAIGEQFSDLTKSSADFTTDVFTVVIVNGSPKFSITANSGTVIKDIFFKASIC